MSNEDEGRLYELSNFVQRAKSSTASASSDAIASTSSDGSGTVPSDPPPPVSSKTKSPSPFAASAAKVKTAPSLFSTPIDTLEAQNHDSAAIQTAESTDDGESPTSGAPSYAARAKERFKFGRNKVAPTGPIPAASVAPTTLQKNHAPKYVVAAVALVLAALAFAFYKQNESDDLATQNAKRALATSKATASTLGSGFSSAANSMPISSPTVVPLAIAPVANVQKPAEILPADGDERYRKMLADIESGRVVEAPSNIGPTRMPAEPASYTRPPAVKKQPPAEARSVPTMLEGSQPVYIEERESSAASAPALYSDVSRASLDVPYLVAKIEPSGQGAAYIYHTLERTGAWLRVGDSLEGGLTIVAIRPYSVVVLDANKRTKTLRMDR